MSPSSVAAATTTTTGTNAMCAASPSETVGPYPSLTDLFRSDIREGKSGTPLTLALTVVNANNGCTPWQGRMWKSGSAMPMAGIHSIPNPGTTAGLRHFSAAFRRATARAAWPSRPSTLGGTRAVRPHIHIDVAVNGRSVKVTQIAFPESVTAALDVTGVYAAKGQNPTRNASDNVFADSVASEMAEVSGSPANGYNATFTVGIAV